MKAFGYCRVSSVGQAQDGVSLDAQRGKIEAWCAANDADLAGVFVDAGLSGGRADNRPALHEALAAACSRKDRGKGNVLVVYSLSRMARSTRDTILIAERLQKAGADLVSLSEKIDTTSAAGKMVFRMLAVFAEFERDLASERTKLAAAYKRGRGEAWAHPPFGRGKDDAGRLVDDPGEMATVAAVMALRAEGLSIRAIVAAMNARGVATRDGGRFHIATVQRILARAAEGPAARGDGDAAA
jgi:site-specific DNA recombinase